MAEDNKDARDGTYSWHRVVQKLLELRSGRWRVRLMRFHRAMEVTRRPHSEPVRGGRYGE